MQRTFYFTDQDVLAEDLNNTETTKATEMKQRVQYLLTYSGGVYGNDPTVSASVYRGGVYGSPADYDEDSVNLIVSKNSATQISMAAGAALDSTGEFILVSGSKTMDFGSSDSNYSWIIPGGPPIQRYYVKLQYAEASGSFKTNDSGVSYPTRYTGSYFVQIDATPPVSTDVLIASFLGDTSGHISGSIKDERLYVSPIVPAGSVFLDPTTKPVGAWNTVEDHVNSVGSGTPSATNPHGLAGIDIGLTDTTQPHRLEAHTAGIVDITGAYDGGSVFYDSYEPVLVNNESSNAGVDFTAPHPSASIVANGGTFTGNLTNIVFSTHPDIIAGGDGTYLFYFDNTTGSVVRVAKDATPADIRYRSSVNFYLFEVYIFSAGTAYSVETFVDYRTFYESNPHRIAADDLELVSNSTIVKSSTLADNLARIRYMLGLALTGNPNDWDAANNPLTDGPTSDASSYHEHTGIQNYEFVINRAEVTADAYIRFEKPSSTEYARLGYRSSVNAFAAIDHYLGAIPVYGKMIVGSLQINNTSNILTETHVAAMPTLTGGPSSDADAYHTHNKFYNPDSGSVVTYNNNSTRKNNSDMPMFISTRAQDNGGGGLFSLYIAPTSASLVSNIVARNTSASSAWVSLFGVIPPGFYYKIYYSPGTLAGSIVLYEYPQVGIDAEGA